MQFEIKNKETIALFKLYVKATNTQGTNRDWRFINQLERLNKKELNNVYYELNKLDYETEYLPKSYNKYKVMNKIIKKMERLKNFFVMKYLTKDD